VLFDLGDSKSSNSKSIMFDTSNIKPRLLYHIVFQIIVVYTMKSCSKNIFHTVMDEGALTCVMSLSCWRSIGSHELAPSPTFLMKFDGHSFRQHGIILLSPSS